MNKWIAGFLILCSTSLSAETLAIYGNDYSAPKIYLDDGEPRGVLVNILKAADAHMPDYEFKFELYPWARTFLQGKNSAGGIIGISKTRERLELFDYSDPVFYDEVLLVARKGEAFDYKEPEDLKGKVLGIGTGGSFGDEFEALRASGAIVVDEDFGPVMRLKKLLAGRVDLAFINPGQAAFHLAISKDDQLIDRQDEFEVLSRPFNIDPNYLAFSKELNRTDFLEEFNGVLNEMRDSDELRRILAYGYLTANQ